MDESRPAQPANDTLFDTFIALEPQDDLAAWSLALPAAMGVCLLRDENHQPLQMLTGADLRRLARSRLAETQPAPSRKIQLRHLVRQVGYRLCYSQFECQFWYFRCLQAVFPQSWQEWLPGLEAWFIEANLNDPLPIFKRTGRYRPDTACWGPLATGKSATLLLDTLQTVFQLCRHPERLAGAPRAAACSYAQMGRCAAVCDGTVSFERYQQQAQQAAALLSDGPAPALRQLTGRLKTSSEALEFEKAAQIHQQIKELKKIGHPAFAWLADMDHFGLVSFQLGPTIKTGSHPRRPALTPFIITAGQITQIEPFTLDQALPACRALLDHYRLSRLQQLAGKPDDLQAHQLAWITQMLYRQHSDKELYLPLAAYNTPESLATAVLTRFTPLLQPACHPGEVPPGRPNPPDQPVNNNC